MTSPGSRPEEATLTFGIVDSLPDEVFEPLRSRFPKVNFVNLSGDGTDDPALLASVSAITSWWITADLLAALPGLRWIHSVGAGVEGFMIPELRARNLILTNNRGSHGPNIAEHVLAMILAFARQLPALLKAQLDAEWRDDETRNDIFELTGQTLLIVGSGEIGSALATRAAALGLNVIGVRRRIAHGALTGLSQLVSLDLLAEVLPEADHVAICLPLTDRTRGLFNTDLLTRMKKSAYLYNIGRGGTVVTTDLIDALRAGDIAGAGLDVTDPEPLPSDSPLWSMGNVLITAHTAGSSPRLWPRTTELLSRNIGLYLAGEPMLNLVDQSEGY
ncbi:MAG: D-2-hydroxyacid dehydrogenase [Chloroflexota bacterium]|nr:D-2-hydroxyacid dehydrogenase [Chloroflexota bacterium]